MHNFIDSSEKDKKICVLAIIGSFYPEITGGGLQALSLMKLLKNVKFYVITGLNNKIACGKHKLGDNIEIFRILSNKVGLWPNIRSFIRSVHVFLKIKHDIDIVHLHGFSQKSILFIVLSKIFRKKIVEKVSSLGFDDPEAVKKSKFGKFKFLFYKHCDAFISTSPAILKGFQKGATFLKKKIFFIPNGVDLKRFRPLNNIEKKVSMRKKIGLRANSIVIIYVGFFSYDKAPEVLWHVFRDLKLTTKYDVQLLFLGFKSSDYFEISPDLILQLQKEVKDFGLEADVLFIEKTLEPEKYYQISDIFVLTSRREGLPNVLLEAMSSGLCCISSSLLGVKNHLINERENGLLFEVGNEEELRCRLDILLQDTQYSLELKKNARKKIESVFSMKSVAGRYLQMYNDLLK